MGKRRKRREKGIFGLEGTNETLVERIMMSLGREKKRKKGNASDDRGGKEKRPAELPDGRRKKKKEWLPSNPA